MKVSIGILAHNEAASIERTLLSLVQQDLFYDGVELAEACELIVVANGCTDDTAEIARSVLSESACDCLTWEVKEIDQAGKSNAWNLYVHDFSRQDADVLFLMDADIWFGCITTLRKMAETMAAAPDAKVVVDTPVKHVAVAEKRSLWDLLYLWASGNSEAGGPAICGQLYCGRASSLRDIWMPEGLPGEDGFVRAMVVTDMFRSSPDPGKVVRAEGAWHVFEAETGPLACLRHNIRLHVGTALNCYLCWDFLLFAVDARGPGAGCLIRDKLAEDPEWHVKLIKNSIKNHGLWVMPRGMFFAAFSSLTRRREPLEILRGLPRCMVSFIFELPVLLLANWNLRKGHGIGYW